MPQIPQHMKPIFVLAFLLLTLPLAAQNQCYQDLRKEGLSLLAQKDYRKAIDKFFAARYCPDKPVKDDLDELIKKTQDAWVKELNDTKKAAQAALQQLQAATAQTVTLFIKEIDQHILQLEYDQAREKTAIALALNAQKKEVVKRLQEVAFFYTETNQFAKADSVLQLLNNKSTLQERPTLLKTIQNLNPSFYDTLQKRYYPEMVYVEGGTFKRYFLEYSWNDEPIDSVNSFKMAKTETTVWQYNIFAIATNEEINIPAWGLWGDNPVSVQYYNAMQYANWLSVQMNVEPVYKGDSYSLSTELDYQAKGYRLPTNTEWEFAARGGNQEKDEYYEYAGGNDLDKLGWYESNAQSRFQPVAKKKPNALNLYDMSGNLREWCLQIKDVNIDHNTFGTDRPSPKFKFINIDISVHGGCWQDHDKYCSVLSYNRFFPYIGLPISDYYNGFRLARY